jgi:hypothetical protein
MIDWWNMVVGPEDEVWHLGDFAFRQRPVRVASLLNAPHDRKLKKQVFSESRRTESRMMMLKTEFERSALSIT